MAPCKYCHTDTNEEEDTSLLVFHAHSATNLQSGCRFLWTSHPHAEKISEVILEWIKRHDLAAFAPKRSLGSRITWRGESKSFNEAFTTLVDEGEFAKLQNQLHEVGFGIIPTTDTDRSSNKGKTLEEIVKEKIRSRIHQVIKGLDSDKLNVDIHQQTANDHENDTLNGNQDDDRTSVGMPGSLPLDSLDPEQSPTPDNGPKVDTKISTTIGSPDATSSSSTSSDLTFLPSIKTLFGPSPLSAAPKQAQEKGTSSVKIEPQKKPQQQTSLAKVTRAALSQQPDTESQEAIAASPSVPASTTKAPRSPPVIPISASATAPVASISLPATSQENSKTLSELEKEVADLLQQEAALVLGEQQEAQRQLAATKENRAPLKHSPSLAGRPRLPVQGPTDDIQSEREMQSAAFVESASLGLYPQLNGSSSTTASSPLKTSPRRVPDSPAAPKFSKSLETKEPEPLTTGFSSTINSTKKQAQGKPAPQPEPEAEAEPRIIGQYPTSPLFSPSASVSQMSPPAFSAIPPFRPETPPFVLPPCETPLSAIDDLNRRIDERFAQCEQYIAETRGTRRR